MHVAFVTAEDQRVLEEDVDRPLHEEAFADRGARLEYRYWSDDTTDWAAYDLVVLRSPWDYSDRIDEFLPWLGAVSDLPTLQNPGGLVRWNLNKSYLLELDAMGVPVVRTLMATDETGVLDALGRIGSSEVIVKPAVSAGSRLTGWFSSTDDAGVDLARQILREGGVVLVEPFVGSVASMGETSVVMFDGHISHSFRKGPILEMGGGFRGGEYQENVSPHEVSSEELAVVEAAHDAARLVAMRNSWLTGDLPLLYSRFDVVELDDGSSALLEAELFEPSFFLAMSDGAAGSFAEACIRRAEALGRRASAGG